jgi:3-hydroxybutyryl-CoA dehydratase
MTERWRYLEDLRVGDTYAGVSGRTITDYDIVGFDGLSGDFSPLHVDHEYAKTTSFGVPIANGFLGITLQAGLIGKLLADAPIAGSGQLKSLSWAFRRPVLRGHTVRARTEILAVEMSAGHQGLVHWRRELLNQNGDVVQDGTLVQCVCSRTDCD